jgi:hypothetical protein
MSISIFPALWRTSKLDQLLESSSELTMEMLEQDDIVEEARFLNERLVRLLATPKAITLLLTHALEGPLPPSPNPNGANPSAPSGPPGRLPAVCTELLNLGLSQVLQVHADPCSPLAIIYVLVCITLSCFETDRSSRFCFRIPSS